MKINSISPISFGKIYTTKDVEGKEALYLHTAYGIGDGSVKKFKEKYRLANLSEKFDIKIDGNKADVFDKKTNQKTTFDSQEYKDYPNALYHVTNAAINYVLLKGSGTFE